MQPGSILWLANQRERALVSDATVTAVQSFHLLLLERDLSERKGGGSGATQVQPAYLDGKGKMRHLDPQPKPRGTGGVSGGSTRV